MTTEEPRPALSLNTLGRAPAIPSHDLLMNQSDYNA